MKRQVAAPIVNSNERRYDVNERQVRGYIFHGGREKRRLPLLNLALYIITIFTTMLAGAFLEGVNPLVNPSALVKGLPFSLTLMLILSAHEFGHYLVSRKEGVESTLPFFIPAPPPIGSFGAIIRMRSVIPSKKVLMAIGAGGPLAGFMVALPAVIVGLSLSSYGVSETQEGGISLGSSLLFSLLTRLVMGVSAGDHDIYLHSVAFAGWWGFFITALNLLPMGQTDGGHVVYSIMGRHHKRVSLAVFLCMVPMGIFLWPGWLMWAVIMFFVGLRHPPVMDETTELDFRHRLVGALVLVIFALTFLPVPIQIMF